MVPVKCIFRPEAGDRLPARKSWNAGPREEKRRRHGRPGSGEIERGMGKSHGELDEAERIAGRAMEV